MTATPPPSAFDKTMEYGCMAAGILMGPLAFIAGIWALVESQRARRAAKASVKWPTVIGEVEKSESTFIQGGGDRASRYIISFLYRYDVDGTSYTSNRVYATDVPDQPTQAHVDAIIGLYPVGTRVYVYYNPKLPQECLLQPGEASSRRAVGDTLGCGIFLVIFGIAASVLMYVALKKDGVIP